MVHTYIEELKKCNRGRLDHVQDNIVAGDEMQIFQYDPKTKQQLAVWVFPGEDPPVQFKRSKSVAKQMVACIFSKSGHVATIPLEDRTFQLMVLY